tara:strand:+ start:24800 stop:26590 length:1791 start_codon:yes stop_codon:yes gene_type:complete
LKGNTDILAPLKRKTSQFLMPQVKGEKGSNLNFDLYPAYELGPGKINMGYADLADYLSDQKMICLDGFSGINWELIITLFASKLKEKGLSVNLINIDSCLKPEGSIQNMIEPFLGEEESVWGTRADLNLVDFFDNSKLRSIQVQEDVDVNIVYGCGASLANVDGSLVYFDLPKNELQYRMRAGSVTNLGIFSRKEDFKTYKHFYFIDWIVLNAEKKKLASYIDVIVDGQHDENPSWALMPELSTALKSMSKSVFRVRPWFEPGAWGGEWIKEHITGLNTEVPNYAWAFSLIVPENGILFQSEEKLLEISFDFLMNQEAENVLGEHYKKFGNEFPIRFNFLDTYNGGNLSIQCHPSLEYIQQVFGENITQDECYYILDCKKDASVYLGFQEDINPDQFRTALEKSQQDGSEISITDYVQQHKSKKHELYLIPNGTIHSAGSGNMVLEISATPYIFTFKMYDWLRLDLDGKPRPININHAFKNLKFHLKGEQVSQELFSNTQLLESENEFEVYHYPTHPDHFYDVRRFDFDESIEVQTHDSCQVMMLVEGQQISIETKEGYEQKLGYAETFVVPAAAESFKLINLGSERAKVINAYLK